MVYVICLYCTVFLCFYGMVSLEKVDGDSALENSKYRNCLLTSITCLFNISGEFLPQSEIQLKILQFGNYWIGFLIYVISFILACDLIWLLRSLLAFKWSWMGGPLIRTKTGVILLAVLVLGGSFLSTLYGAVHAKKIKTSFHDITINKQVDDLKEMKVVLIADLHLGYSVGSKDMQKMVDRINKQDPDLVVLAGDIFDNEYEALDDPNTCQRHCIRFKASTGHMQCTEIMM